MKKYTIDRFEGDYAVCEEKGGGTVDIERARLPEGAAEGSVLSVADNGDITLSEDAGRERRIRERMKALWK
jgi:hypothetical protein